LKLEIRSIKRGICPIATLALRLTLYSLTGSRVWPLGSLDIIGHVSIGTADGPFLLVVCWCQVTISHGCQDIDHQTCRSHDLDPFGLCDVIGHVTIRTTDGPFLLVIHWHNVPILHRCRDIEPQTFWGSRPWPFQVTWRHRSRDHWNRRWSFPIGHPL